MGMLWIIRLVRMASRAVVAQLVASTEISNTEITAFTQTVDTYDLELCQLGNR